MGIVLQRRLSPLLLFCGALAFVCEQIAVLPDLEAAKLDEESKPGQSAAGDVDACDADDMVW